ncbi:hypothetical protein BGZ51_009640 [Haplosporangium sp. Z 767]|nr:hypothetical protein BGZ50_005854 [Haplosporangium sp. Z 11]KAF9189407.1 hypothetical protein BGZ51_009640 [Haplosporangium sp. Z 767]
MKACYILLLVATVMVASTSARPVASDPGNNDWQDCAVRAGKARVQCAGTTDCEDVYNAAIKECNELYQ